MFQQKKALLDWWLGDQIGFIPTDLGNKLKLWLDNRSVQDLLIDSGNNVGVDIDKSIDYTIGANLFTTATNVTWNSFSFVGGVISVTSLVINEFCFSNAISQILIQYGNAVRVSFDLVVISGAGIKIGWSGSKVNPGGGRAINSFVTAINTGSYSIDLYCTNANDASAYIQFISLGVTSVVISNISLKKLSDKRNFPQDTSIARPLWNTINNITFDGVSDFLDGTTNLAIFTALSSGSISFVVGGTLATNRLSTLTMGNTLDDTESFRCGIDSLNKIYYFVQFGAILTYLFSNTPTILGDIVQIRSVGGIIKMYINGIEDIVNISSGINLGEWFDKPNVDTISIGALIRLTSNYWAEDLKSIIITTNENDQDLLNISNYLKDNF